MCLFIYPYAEVAVKAKGEPLIDALVLVEATLMATRPPEPLMRSGSTLTIPKNSKQRAGLTVDAQDELGGYLTPLLHERAWESVLK